MNNYTGAEIMATVKSASSFAFQRINSIFDFGKKAQAKNEEFKVTARDFELALEEVKPQFGIDNSKFEVLLRNPLINYGANYERILKILESSIE